MEESLDEGWDRLRLVEFEVERDESEEGRGGGGMAVLRKTGLGRWHPWWSWSLGLGLASLQLVEKDEAFERNSVEW